MHNVPVRRILATTLLLVPALAGCSGEEEPAADEPTASASASETPTVEPTPTPEPLPVPAGVELTEQGTALELGDKATVAYEPKQDTVGVLDITVTDMRRTTFKQSFQGWKLNESVTSANPYFVEATFKNVGETDLGGRAAPLYLVDGQDTLVESTTFASDFEPCASTTFPKKFKPGKKVTRCLVYLSPDKGELVSISFRPAQEYEPITWSGEVLKLGVKRPSDKKKSGGNGGNNGGNNDSNDNGGGNG